MNQDPLLWNKILGAVLGALLIGTLAAFAAEILYGKNHGEEHSDEGQGVALTLVSVESNSSSESADAESQNEPVVPLDELLAKADPEHGKALSRKCTACHTFIPGGANRVGPNLWSVAGKKVASNANFKYSSALKDFGGSWSNEKLNAFLLKPKAAVKGTKMNFVGLKKAQDRADVIAWLQSLK